jgi:hypothetical protein
METDEQLSVETIFVELLWQKAAELRIDDQTLFDKAPEYQRLRDEIIQELKTNSKIDLEYAQELITVSVDKEQVVEFSKLLENESEENRIIERSIFIGNQERHHNDDLYNIYR